MKRLLYIIAFVLVLATSGFVAISFMEGKSPSQLSAKQVSATPIALPTALVGFPDIEHVPVYPHASVTFTATEEASSGLRRRHVTYQVEERMDKVAEFYQEMLPKMGWLLRSSHGGRNLYSWTDPEGKLLWQMYLEVVIELTLDMSKTVVYLDYGRYPNTEEGLPLYTDAQQVSVTHSNIERSFSGEKTSVAVTDITYLSGASPQETATFYINSMQEYGWRYHGPGSGWSTRDYPFDDPGSWEGYSPREGLYFVASRPGWGEDPTVSSTYLLLATAKLQEDGRVIIKLHVEEYESSLRI